MSRVDHYLIWFLAGTLIAAAIAWIAFRVQQERIAPAVLFPLAVGGMLGAALAALRRATGVPGRRLAVASAFAWGLLVVVGQDYIGHKHRLAAYQEQMVRQAPLATLGAGEPNGLEPRFVEYVSILARREPVWWILDLVLTAGAAALVTARSASPPRATTASDA